MADQRQNILQSQVFPTQQQIPASRPRSLASIPTAVRMLVPTTTIYATTERRSNPNRQNALHRRSLQSPMRSLDDGMASRAPLMAQQPHAMTSRAPQSSARIPLMTPRSALIRIPTESAV
ncbi:hypothetical protein E2C01_033642 [Portunus trituberculatus]|uniref:Uncharacterized protein n=1 Tax=Portunus trituberculatus TaxID=210409 RepID=A0A5B7F4M6_PORTR|nr:hypothetical protein [Portunus trituberculatus]